MNNYEYCSDFVSNIYKNGNKVLDYGCGTGHIVRALRQKNIDAVGCDIFYQGADRLSQIAPEELGSIIFPMKNGLIPFQNEEFDIVVSNQVLEHVEDLDSVVREIYRVMKPGGCALIIFPDISVVREGHCGIPLLHWFSKKSKLRVYYAYALRSIGLGYHKRDKSAWQWANDFCEWLDCWTYYRPYSEIKITFEKYFSSIDHVEDQWITARLGQWCKIMPKYLLNFLTRKLMGLVLVVHKIE